VSDWQDSTALPRITGLFRALPAMALTSPRDFRSTSQVLYGHLAAAAEEGLPPLAAQRLFALWSLLTGDPIRAEELYRRALAADPDNTDMRLGLAFACDQRGQGLVAASVARSVKDRLHENRDCVLHEIQPETPEMSALFLEEPWISVRPCIPTDQDAVAAALTSELPDQQAAVNRLAACLGEAIHAAQSGKGTNELVFAFVGPERSGRAHAARALARALGGHFEEGRNLDTTAPGGSPKFGPVVVLDRSLQLATPEEIRAAALALGARRSRRDDSLRPDRLRTVVVLLVNRPEPSAPVGFGTNVGSSSLAGHEAGARAFPDLLEASDGIIHFRLPTGTNGDRRSLAVEGCPETR
jgi:hypothetical protein